MNILELEGVSKHFAGIKALDDVSFAVEEGSITALIGPNGAGKTTLINLITGIFAPTGGGIRFLGRDLKGLSPAEVGYAGIRRTFQTVHLFPGLTVAENVALGRYRNSVKENPWRALLPGRFGDTSGRREIADILDRLRLSDKADVIATELPYGTQRKVEIARALAGAPKLILLDEPAAGMNEAETDELREQIRAIRGDGVTVLLIEHDMNLVMSVSDTIVVVDFGRKIAAGTPEAVRCDPAVIKSYLGELAA